MSDSNCPILFTVIIPTYNRAGLIRTAIDSILKQEYTNYEIIIVDDGSTDDTEQVIKTEYRGNDKVRYIKQQNAERGAARNTGLKNAKGKYITYMDSDDIIYPTYLSAAYTEILNDENLEALHLNYVILNKNTGKSIKAKNIKDTYANRLLIRGNFMSCIGVVIKKEIAMANMFIEDRDPWGEDWELWLRIASKHRIKSIDTVHAALIDHGNRSVVSDDMNNLIKKVNKLMQYVLCNADVVAYYKNDINKFISSCYTYIALHIAITHKNRLQSARYLVKGISKNWLGIFDRRFLAIIKHLLIFK
jgi:glycosyltransferase involved in cell wall biosynthesis